MVGGWSWRRRLLADWVLGRGGWGLGGRLVTGDVFADGGADVVGAVADAGGDDGVEPGGQLRVDTHKKGHTFGHEAASWLIEWQMSVSTALYQECLTMSIPKQANLSVCRTF